MLRLAVDSLDEERVIFEFVDVLDRLAIRWDSENLADALSVRVVLEEPLAPASASAPEPLPALVGDWDIDGANVRFRPRFPLRAGLRYRGEYRDRERGVIGEELTFRPQGAAVPRPAVVAVYPSGGAVPANLLKFYLRFSQPMAMGHAYRCVRVRDAEGRVVEHPFLELDEELWNEDGTRVTLFLDPGRIKRGVLPHDVVGPALVAGGTHTLEVDGGWPSAVGATLGETFRREYTVVAPDVVSPEIANWRVVVPRAGTTEPMAIEFPEPLDHALLERLLWIRGPDEVEVVGAVAIGPEERSWRLLPESPWDAGVHQIVTRSTLEDLAGNSLARPFEVDVFAEVRERFVVDTVTREFTVLPGR